MKQENLSSRAINAYQDGGQPCERAFTVLNRRQQNSAPSWKKGATSRLGRQGSRRKENRYFSRQFRSALCDIGMLLDTSNSIRDPSISFRQDAFDQFPFRWLRNNKG